MSPSRPLVLLSNDDGYAAEGIRAVATALAPHADVVICAPELNQSATSHSLSLHRVLRLRSTEPNVFLVDGTPADCVYVALHAGTRVLPRLPDLCVSGLNHGLNLGVDVFYSGTVAAAREAALRGIPSVALSADAGADRSAAAELGARIALAALARVTAPAPVLLNVNFPRGRSWQVRDTKLGHRTYEGEVVFRRDPRGQEYMWIGGGKPTHREEEGADTDAYDRGLVGVTPLSLSLDEPAQSGLAREVARAVS